MFYRAFYVSYLLKVWVFVHVPSISPPIAAAPHQLRHYFVTYRNLHTSGPYSAAFLGQREPQQLQTEGLRGMSDARCGGRSDCKSCLAKSGGCSWCTYTDSTGAAAATCLFEDTANLCEDIRTVCPVAVESESSVAPIETVVGGAVGVAVGSCGLVFLFLYIMVRTFQQRPRMRLCSLSHTRAPCAQIYREKYRRRRRRARNRDQAMARRGHEVARGLEAVSAREAEHRELQSQGGAAGSLLRKQLETALHFLPTSEYGARARAAGGALERADKPAKKGRGEGQTGDAKGGPSNEQEEAMCSICLNDYEEDKMCSTLPCGHVFHRECITCWLRSGRMAGAECPLCKVPSVQANPPRSPSLHRLLAPALP